MNNRPWHNILTIITILAISLLYYNISANWHYHQSDNGIAIKHAHPFNTSNDGTTPFQDHKHSDSELLVLAQIMHSMALLSVVLILLGLILEKKKEWVPSPISQLIQEKHLGPDLIRGPPSCL